MQSVTPEPGTTPEPAAPERAASRRFNPTAAISMLSGIISYALVLLHSLINMRLWVAGVLGLFTAFLAVTTGHRAKRLMRKSDGAIGGRKMAKTGLILGYLYLAVNLLIIVVVVLLLAGVISGFSNLLSFLGIR
jgi:hypothetical protein